MGILQDKLDAGAVICAEGYLFELERRGYLQAGSFVPEVVLEHPEAVMQLHRDFRRAGSDVIVAFTYYAHREKMRLIGKEHLIEPLQKEALRLAKEAAAEAADNPPMVAGNICNTNVYLPDDKKVADEVKNMFTEQLNWAAEAGVDFVLLETFSWYGEALLALQAAQETGLETVVNFAVHSGDSGTLREGMSPVEACRRLADAGATVVGLNCARGPTTTLPILLEVRKTVSCHIAGIPVTYRTDNEHPTMQSLKDHHPQCCVPEGMRSFPVGLDPFVCTRFELAKFARDCTDNDIRMVGVCCGGAPHHIRAMAEALGRHPEAAKYSHDMSKHYALGTDPSLLKENQAFKEKL